MVDAVIPSFKEKQMSVTSTRPAGRMIARLLPVAALAVSSAVLAACAQEPPRRATTTTVAPAPMMAPAPAPAPMAPVPRARG